MLPQGLQAMPGTSKSVLPVSSTTVQYQIDLRCCSLIERPLTIEIRSPDFHLASPSIFIAEESEWLIGDMVRQGISLARGGRWNAIRACSAPKFSGNQPLVRERAQSNEERVVNTDLVA
jgi:hypothetical protein